MSIILILCIAVALGWLVLSLVGRPQRSAPTDSVADFARALSALSHAPTPTRQPARSTRPAARRQATGGRRGAVVRQPARARR